jgi:hypothetical protein
MPRAESATTTGRIPAERSAEMAARVLVPRDRAISDVIT